MHIASINLRIDVPVDGKYQWSYRKERMIDFILDQRFDVIGMQEAGPGMFKDLQDGLSHDYHLIYKGRDSRGEGTPIAIHKSLQILESGTLWLTDTPEVESTIKGSNFPRIVTYTRIGGTPTFYVFNTHLDYSSDEVCHRQADYLIKIIQKVNQQKLPYIITGDFNQYPDSLTISRLTNTHQSIYNSMKQYPLTFHGFSENIVGEPIDYIFLSDAWTIQTSIIHRHQEKGKYLSDHFPISIQITKK